MLKAVSYFNCPSVRYDENQLSAVPYMQFRYASSSWSRSPVTRMRNAPCSARSLIWGAAHRLHFLQRLFISRRRLIRERVSIANERVSIANENAVTCFLEKGAIFLWTLTRSSPESHFFVKHRDPLVIVIMTRVNTRGRSHMQFVVSTLGL